MGVQGRSESLPKRMATTAAAGMSTLGTRSSILAATRSGARDTISSVSKRPADHSRRIIWNVYVYRPTTRVCAERVRRPVCTSVNDMCCAQYGKHACQGLENSVHISGHYVLPVVVLEVPPKRRCPERCQLAVATWCCCMPTSKCAPTPAVAIAEHPQCIIVLAADLQPRATQLPLRQLLPLRRCAAAGTLPPQQGVRAAGAPMAASAV